MSPLVIAFFKNEHALFHYFAVEIMFTASGSLQGQPIVSKYCSAKETKREVNKPKNIHAGEVPSSRLNQGVEFNCLIVPLRLSTKLLHFVFNNCFKG